jgi:excisionase family DNA binding protein
MSKIKSEVSVQEAADHLGVTTRSVLNYINQKEIEAIKVGKTWFIKAPSLDAFITRFGFKKIETAPTLADGNIENITPKQEAIASITQAGRKPAQSLPSLRLYSILRSTLIETNLPKEQDESIRQHFYNLKLEAIELLGAGFYAYEFQHKKSYYNMSRQKISGLLSLLHTFDSKNERIKILEQELLPAYSALIKKLEKSNGKKNEASKNLR